MAASPSDSCALLAARFSVASDASPLAPPAGTPILKYCNVCGGPRLLEDECVACSTQRASTLELKPPHRVAPAMALYFLLLGFLLATMLFEFTPTVELVASGLMTVLVAAFGLVMRHEIKDAMTLCAWRWFVAALSLAPVTFAISTGVVHALDQLLGVPTLEYLAVYADNGVPWSVIVLLVCLQPAVVEELAFRGIVFAALRRVMGPVETVVVSAFMFMTIHLSPVNAPHLFIMGLALGFLRYRSKSLLPGVGLHFAHNFMCVML